MGMENLKHPVAEVIGEGLRPAALAADLWSDGTEFILDQ